MSEQSVTLRLPTHLRDEAAGAAAAAGLSQSEWWRRAVQAAVLERRVGAAVERSVDEARALISKLRLECERAKSAELAARLRDAELTLSQLLEPEHRHRLARLHAASTRRQR